MTERVSCEGTAAAAAAAAAQPNSARGSPHVAVAHGCHGYHGPPEGIRDRGETGLGASCLGEIHGTREQNHTCNQRRTCQTDGAGGGESASGQTNNTVNGHSAVGQYPETGQAARVQTARVCHSANNNTGPVICIMYILAVPVH